MRLLPHRGVLQGEDYSRMYLWAEFQGSRRKLGRVSGSSDARIWRAGGGDVEPRHLNHGPKSEMTASNGSEAPAQVSSGETISPADSKFSLFWLLLGLIVWWKGGK